MRKPGLQEFKIANPTQSSEVINGHSFSVWEEACALQDCKAEEENLGDGLDTINVQYFSNVIILCIFRHRFWHFMKQL